MLQPAWNVSPDDLEPLDASIVRCISGVMTDDFMSRMLGPEHFAVRRRLVALMEKHSPWQFADLAKMTPERRRALAESIVLAEIAEHFARPEIGAVPGVPGVMGVADESSPARPSPGARAVRQAGSRYVKPTRKERERAAAAAVSEALKS
jgi:hypothetical protein